MLASRLAPHGPDSFSNGLIAAAVPKSGPTVATGSSKDPVSGGHPYSLVSGKQPRRESSLSSFELRKLFKLLFVGNRVRIFWWHFCVNSAVLPRR